MLQRRRTRPTSVREHAAKRAFLLAIAIAFAFPGAATAGFEDGLAAYKRHDYAAALAEWRSLAEQGDPAAQFYLGEMYRQGHGRPYDPAEAGRWYRRAAEQGHAVAQLRLAGLYRAGQGVDRDERKAALWLGRAAAAGNATAMRRLGKRYATGAGVRRDLVQAHKWLALAAARGGDITGFLAASDLRRLREDMSAAAIAKAERLAHAWKPSPKAPLAGRPSDPDGSKPGATPPPG